MVVILTPASVPIGAWHERIAWPFRCTVQAPHWAMPQPYLVPVISSSSRSTQSSGVSGAASTATTLPLTLSVVAMTRASIESDLNDVKVFAVGLEAAAAWGLNDDCT